jgi:hypothetical protein
MTMLKGLPPRANMARDDLTSNSNFGDQDVSSWGVSLGASLDSSSSPLIMKSIT